MIQALPFSVPVFLIAAIAFALFSLLYFIVAASIIYHLRTFSFPGHIAPYVVSTAFTAISCLLWLAGLMFLLQIPR